jgi:hypothetical protein
MATNVKQLATHLRAAGFGSFADTLEKVHMSTNKPGHAKLRQAITLLQGRRQWAIAEQVDQVRVSLYGPDPIEPNPVSVLGTLVDQLLQGACPGCDPNDQRYQQAKGDLLNCVQPYIEQLCEQAQPAGGDESPGGVENDLAPLVEGMGPGFEMTHVKAPQTVQLSNQSPWPTREDS